MAGKAAFMQIRVVHKARAFSDLGGIFSRLKGGVKNPSTGPTESEKEKSRKRYEAQCEIKYGKKKWEKMKAEAEAKKAETENKTE